MKRILILSVILVCLLLVNLPAWAESSDSDWGISIQTWDVSGSFDYMLYHSENQIKSKVDLPQDQVMYVLEIQRELPAWKKGAFLEFQYGQSFNEKKGRGFDKDWDSSGFLTDYGSLDSYGNQNFLTLNIGKTIAESERQTTRIFGGYIRQANANEIINVVYHRYYGIDVADDPHIDNGSTLDMVFQGVQFGAKNEQRFAKMTLNSSLSLAALETKAHGIWNNHSPAWDWENTGYTLGIRADLGLSYAITEHIAAKLGYYYVYAKNSFDLDVCDEHITGAGYPDGGTVYENSVILRHEQRGLRFGVEGRF